MHARFQVTAVRMHCVPLMLTIGLAAVQDFLRNNRGINDGGDLPEDFMSSLYERIQTNEIKMKVCRSKSCTSAPVVTLQYQTIKHA